MSKICALIILYNGQELTETTAEGLVYKMQNMGLIDKQADATLVYKDPDAIAKAIIAQEEERKEHERTGSQLHFIIPEGKKLQTVKFLKEEFNLGIAKAREAADTGCIIVEHPNYDSILKGFCKIGVRATGLADDIALQQAVIYINERYPRAHMDKTFMSTLVRDVLDAKDRNDNFSIALIESIRLIANASFAECKAYGMHENVYGNVCTTYNVLVSM